MVRCQHAAAAKGTAMLTHSGRTLLPSGSFIHCSVMAPRPAVGPGASGQCWRSRCCPAAIHAAGAFLLQLPSPCHNSCLIKCTALQKMLSTARRCVPGILQRPEKQAEIRFFASSSDQKTGAGSHGIGSGRFYNGAVRIPRSPSAAIQTVIPEIAEIPEGFSNRKSFPTFLR